MKVRKAVITAAGWGTRFLPVTRCQPKEMLPLLNKPLIHYAVEEIIGSGIERIIMVTSLGKDAVEDYFDRSFELEYFLEQKGDKKLAREMHDIASLTDVCFVRQKEQLGLGHAVLMTKDIVGDEPFALLLPDDIIDSKVPALRQLLDVYERHDASVIAVERVSYEAAAAYGIITPREIAPRLFEVLGLVEKPEPAKAPSNLGIVGRYILAPEIFKVLGTTPRGAKGEIQLTDAIALMLRDKRVLALEFQGIRYDVGNPLGWLKANIAFGLASPDLAPPLREYLRKLL